MRDVLLAEGGATPDLSPQFQIFGCPFHPPQWCKNGSCPESTHSNPGFQGANYATRGPTRLYEFDGLGRIISKYPTDYTADVSTCPLSTFNGTDFAVPNRYAGTDTDLSLACAATPGCPEGADCGESVCCVCFFFWEDEL